jgi:hypothetical protein
MNTLVFEGSHHPLNQMIVLGVVIVLLVIGGWCFSRD